MFAAVFASILAERYNCIANFDYCHGMLSVRRLSRVYCDEKPKARIMRFSLENSEMY